MMMMDNGLQEEQQDLEKQIGGCMAGFFNIFDRPNLISPRRLSLSPESDSPLKSVYATTPDPSPHSLTRSPLPLLQPSSSSSSSSSSPWRFSKEAPRLSLDSRAALDAKGTLKPRQIRLDSDPPQHDRASPSVIARLMGLDPLPQQQQPLQRSASESRLTRDYRFVDTFTFLDEKGPQDPAARPPPLPVRRKCFFDSGDFFPVDRVPKTTGSPTDLETFKQLVEALRLKGLLHSSNKHQHNKTPIHIKPASGIRSRPPSKGPSPPKSNRTRPTATPKEQRRVSPLPWQRPQPLQTATPKEQRRVSPLPWQRPQPLQTATLEEQRRVSPLPWQRPQPLQTGFRDDQRSTIICSQEMCEVDGYNNRQGKTLLERCDKLLHSIAEMAAAEAGDSQPSPVSVLDASLYHEEEDSSPSPVMKRSLDFSAESEDESWGGSISPSSDSEYLYISDILRASHCLPQESDIFSVLEKQQYLQGKCASAQQRRLIFDAVQEIVGRRRRLPPWRMVGEPDKMQVFWSEYQKMRKKTEETSEDLVGYVCGVLARDLSEDRWRDCQVEMSEAVLDIERLVFKDLIGETIRHLASLKRSDSLRRRLLF
ncbi:hypothetical protein CARUB_v10018814mg [Capsella rubella]|uniref:DUF4378 domain-containing protein n=1 Tax=Capsella rubella TaxID=81985 RepID=R0HJU5_9BRAS|nr:uncharacterized protein LOC17885667 [Capsella rubella]EOA25475.1 hypothetical protein CARUB_v10018814mg [Capsella rubella]